MRGNIEISSDCGSDVINTIREYGQAIAFLISVEEWNRMKSEIRESSLDRLALGGYASSAASDLREPPRKTSVN